MLVSRQDTALVINITRTVQSLDDDDHINLIAKYRVTYYNNVEVHVTDKLLLTEIVSKLQILNSI